MAYSKQTWKDGDADTPLSAARLGHIETGIAEASASASQAEASASEASDKADAAIQAASAAEGSREVVSHVLSFVGATMYGSEPPNRRNLSIQGDSGIGVIHLDYQMPNPAGIIATLPNDAPLPVNLIEVQHPSGGSIWMNPGQRDIECDGATLDTRIVVDLVGFFEG